MIAQLEQEPQTHVMNISKFERFFRMGAGLDVDKQDLKRYSEFVHHKLYDLLLRGNSTAGANGRDVIEFFDLPITKGLQECIHVFASMSSVRLMKTLNCSRSWTASRSGRRSDAL
jgi:hypothetical protein